jgi:hypothetical protein
MEIFLVEEVGLKLFYSLPMAVLVVFADLDLVFDLLAFYESRVKGFQLLQYPFSSEYYLHHAHPEVENYQSSQQNYVGQSAGLPSLAVDIVDAADVDG